MQAQKHFFPYFTLFFMLFFSLFAFFMHKRWKRHILTSVWRKQHPNAGQNIQHLLFLMKGISLSLSLSLIHIFVCLSLSLFLSPSLLFHHFVPLYLFSLPNLSISHTHKHTQHISFILATPIQAPSNTPIHCSTPSCLSFCSVLPNNPMCFVNFKRDLVLPESLRKK